MSIFKDKVIIVTGATRGIGLDIVKILLTKKAKLSLCARNTSKLFDEIRDICIKNEVDVDESILIEDCDVSNYSQVCDFIKKTYNKFNKIDILINNAAIGKFNKIEDFCVEDWDSLININLNSIFYFCKETIPILRKNKDDVKGYIFNIGSLSHNLVVSQNSAYSSSKAATKTFSDHLYNELRSENILVTYIAAGSVNTSFSKRNPDNIGWKIRPQNVAEIVISILKLGYVNSQCCINYLEVKTNSPMKVESFKE